MGKILMLAGVLGATTGIFVASSSMAQTNLYRCAGPDGKRFTRDQHDIRVGERCEEVSKEERARMKAAAARPPTPTEEQDMRIRAARFDFWRLCGEVGKVLRKPDVSPRGQVWEKIVIDRSGIPSQDIGYIRERRLRVGMDECGVAATLGKPDGGMNRTNHAQGRSDQWVYRERRMYVYTENGIVRAWQE